MGKTLKIQLMNARDELIHEFRNYGEDVWRELRHVGEVSLAEIDGTAEVFHMRSIRTHKVRTVTARLHAIAERHGNLCIQVEEA